MCQIDTAQFKKVVIFLGEISAKKRVFLSFFNSLPMMKQNVIIFFIFSSHTEKANFAICLLPLEFQERKISYKIFGRKAHANNSKPFASFSCY